MQGDLKVVENAIMSCVHSETLEDGARVQSSALKRARKERRQGRLCRSNFVGSLRLRTSTVTNARNQSTEKFATRLRVPSCGEQTTGPR